MPKGKGYNKTISSKAKKHNSNNPKKKSGKPSETTKLSPEKAKIMLKEDGSRSKKQRGFLGAVAGKGAKKK